MWSGATPALFPATNVIYVVGGVMWPVMDLISEWEEMNLPHASMPNAFRQSLVTRANGLIRRFRVLRFQ